VSRQLEVGAKFLFVPRVVCSHRDLSDVDDGFSLGVPAAATLGRSRKRERSRSTAIQLKHNLNVTPLRGVTQSVDPNALTSNSALACLFFLSLYLVRSSGTHSACEASLSNSKVLFRTRIGFSSSSAVVSHPNPRNTGLPAKGRCEEPPMKNTP
jgi:hypothetical protein